MNPRRIPTTLIALLLGLFLAAPLTAQDAGTDEKKAPEAKAEEKKAVESAEELAKREADVRKNLKDIEETMARIADIMARTDPEKAALLQMALKRSRLEDQNQKLVQEIENLLRNGDFDKALRKQWVLKRNLDKIIDILMDRDADLKDVRDEIKRLEDQLSKLNSILEEERKQFHNTEKFADPEASLARAAAARARLDDLIARQKAQNAGAEQAAADQKAGKGEGEAAVKEAARLKKDQNRLRRDTDRLARDVEKLARQTKGADGGKGALSEAGKAMKGAEESLQGGQPNAAAQKGQEALKKLEEARKKLERLEEQLKKETQLPDYEKMAKEQDGTTEKTKELEKSMDGQNGGKGSPGGKEVGEAKRAMQRASRNLRSKSAKGANSDQKEAVDRLKKAKEELEDALRQLREEEQLMLLDALEKRLVRMLQQQREISKSTIALHLRTRDAKKPAREDVSTGKKLSQGEAELAAQAEKVLEIMKEEGSTVVIPEIVQELRNDLDNLSQRLVALKAGEYTQQVQADVELTLEELIKVIQEERKRRQGRQGEGNGDGQEGDQDENLLPTSAELKMLRSLQVRVNKRTSLFERMRRAGKTGEGEVKSERGRLSKKQDHVSGLTRTMADRLNREEE